MTTPTDQAAQTNDILGTVAQELRVTEDDVIRQGLRALLARLLRQIRVCAFEITGLYGVSSVEEMEARYREGTLEEADSWHDLQRLDHLQYKRDRLSQLIEALP